MKRRYRTGFLTLEFIISLVLVTTILALFAYELTQFARLNDMLAIRQRATLAAEAVLNALRAGHEPAPAELTARFAGLTFDIQRRPGSGEWQGLTRVSVEVEGTAFGGTRVRTQLEGYVREVSP